LGWFLLGVVDVRRCVPLALRLALSPKEYETIAAGNSATAASGVWRTTPSTISTPTTMEEDDEDSNDDEDDDWWIDDDH
jgi:hypothetical protein